jgi:rubrerythrin
MKELEELRKQVTREEIAETMKILAKDEKPKAKVTKKRAEPVAELAA